MDSESEFQIMQGLIRNKLWTLAGIYAPQIKKVEFYKSLMKTLEEFTEGNETIKGGFNTIANSLLDKYIPGSPHSEIPNIFENWTKDKGLKDCWRLENIQCRDYIFFSNPHKSYSRIDYIFVKHHSSIKILWTNIDS